jgi:hypothetical protein
MRRPPLRPNRRIPETQRRHPWRPGMVTSYLPGGLPVPGTVSVVHDISGR